MNPAKAIVIALLILPLLACDRSEPAASDGSLPGLPREEIRLDDEHRLWVYKPDGDAQKRPLVLIAPAGSPMYFGMSLSEGDIPEHEPYVRAGCIVIAYDVSGPEPSNEAELSTSVKEFMQAGGGVADGKRALDYALENMPEVDPNRIISVGHSSAGTISLQLARADKRISACIAYAPCVDVKDWLTPDLPQIEAIAPGFTEFVNRSSPAQWASDFAKPTYLFVSTDDAVIDISAIRKFATEAADVELAETTDGGHYDAMIKEGIPGALEWLRQKKLVP